MVTTVTPVANCPACGTEQRHVDALHGDSGKGARYQLELRGRQPSRPEHDPRGHERLEQAPAPTSWLRSPTTVGPGIERARKRRAAPRRQPPGPSTARTRTAPRAESPGWTRSRAARRAAASRTIGARRRRAPCARAAARRAAGRVPAQRRRESTMRPETASRARPVRGAAKGAFGAKTIPAAAAQAGRAGACGRSQAAAVHEAAQGPPPRGRRRAPRMPPVRSDCSSQVTEAEPQDHSDSTPCATTKPRRPALEQQLQVLEREASPRNRARAPTRALLPFGPLGPPVVVEAVHHRARGAAVY